MMKYPMKISPTYSIADWKKLDFSAEGDWPTAVAIFEDRIRGRFLDMVDKIEDRPFAGFAVLALDCLLIETLQQFYEGTSETPYKKGEEYFVNFLTRTAFNEHFDKEQAQLFYDHIRCGILHQAETKEGSLIHLNGPLVILTSNPKSIVINRKKFHKKLLEVFERYLSQLKDPSNGELRDNFKRKMNYICRLDAGS